jgi:hypothetical protein
VERFPVQLPPPPINKNLPFGRLLFHWRWRELTLRSSPSRLLAPGRGSRPRAHPCALDHSPSSYDRMASGATSRSTPPTSPNEKTPLREFFLRWRWRELNPRPRARTANVYRFIRPFELSGRGQRTGAPSLPYPGCSPPAPSGRNRSEPRLVSGASDAQGGATANPSLSALTRRERNCRCCWQLKFCRIRRSAAPPAARDPDRSGRNRYTPLGENRK